MKVGCYELMETIGSGSFSIVYKGINCFTNTDVAIKVITKSQENSVIFQSETSILSQLDHPLIAPIFDVLEDDKNYYLILELLNNFTLLEFINQTGGLSEKVARKYFTQLLAAIEYLHQTKMVIHRDLKTENIIIGPNQLIRLIDFGLSKQFTETNQHLKTLCGSVAYASPEVLSGKEYTTLADIWSLGVILYAMVAGSLPFNGESVPEIMNKILNDEPTYSDELSPELVDLLKKILNKDPLKRMTLSEIKQHQWLTRGRDLVEKVFSYLKSNELKICQGDELDKTILRELKNLNMYTNDISAKLIGKRFDQPSAAYRILRREQINISLSKHTPGLNTGISSRSRPSGLTLTKPILPVLDNNCIPTSPCFGMTTRKRLCKRNFGSLNFGIENAAPMANLNISKNAFVKSPKIRRRLIHPNAATHDYFINFSPC